MADTVADSIAGRLDSTVEALTTHVLEQGCDPDRAAAIAGGVFAPHRLKLGRPGDSIDFSLNAGTVGGTALARVAYGAPVRVETEGLVDKLAISIPGSGAIDFVQHGVTHSCDPNQTWVFGPGVHTRMRLTADVELTTLFVNPVDLREQLSRLIGFDCGPGIQFDSVGDSTSALRPIFNLIERTLSEARQRGFLSPLVAVHLDQMILTTLLLSHPHTFTDELFWRGVPGSPRVVRLVERALRERPEHPWTVGDLATEAGVSGRTVQLAFQRHVGMGPFEMLRMIRLERANDDLRNPGQGDTVTTIAMRWGFTHVGRFAAAYRRRYQATPSETLRRSR